MVNDNNLTEAQRLVFNDAFDNDQEIQRAQALALIDIAHSLRDIRDEMKDWHTYGFNVKKHVR